MTVIPGKIVRFQVTEASEDHFASIYALTEDGRLFAAPLKGDWRDLVWDELSKELDVTRGVI